MSVSVVGDNVYLLVKRGADYFIELIDDNLHLDSALSGESGTPTSTWAGLNYLEGQTLSIVADGKVETNKTVTTGQITTDSPASTLQAGLPFTHIIEPLPPANISEIGYSRAVRMVEATFGSVTQLRSPSISAED